MTLQASFWQRLKEDDEWPQGSTPVDVLGVLDRARGLQLGDCRMAEEIVETLAFYVDSLPSDQQQAVARRLVDRLRGANG